MIEGESINPHELIKRRTELPDPTSEPPDPDAPVREGSVYPRELMDRLATHPEARPASSAIPPAGAQVTSRLSLFLLALSAIGMILVIVAVLLPRILKNPTEANLPLIPLAAPDRVASPPARLSSLPRAELDPASILPAEPPRPASAPGFQVDGSIMVTPFQAIVLVGGQTLYGRLDRSGDAWPLLTDVYLIQQSVNPTTKEVTNTLVMRANEPHAPDRMAINPTQILFVEPIHPGSKIARLIDELKKGRSTLTNPPSPASSSAPATK